MTRGEELVLRRHVRRVARELGLLGGKAALIVRPLAQRYEVELDGAPRPERERFVESGCSRAFNPAGLR